MHNSISRLQDDNNFLESPQNVGEENGHFGGMKLIENPPDLQQWRERLFDVDETITLTEQEFQTYFPHVDNVYSHRSTQKYKRKPFVSHYWDCRLKGRPPGTPKSNDPTKKKRKRTARERDLCDVKIKITEFFPGAAATMSAADFASSVEGMPVDLTTATNFFVADSQNGVTASGTNESQPFGVLAPTTHLPIGHPGASGAKYYTIQRVNGNSTGKGDSIGGPHKHTLEESDRVKKNSVQRWLLKEAKEKKKFQVREQNSLEILTRQPKLTSHLSQQQQQRQQQEHESQDQPQPSTTSPITSRVPTKRLGPASQTVKRHSKESDLKFFSSRGCPFCQRIWIALEVKGLAYQYVEVDMLAEFQPPALLEVSPKGILPAIRHGSNWGTFESKVIMEYIDREVIPSFYELLRCTDPSQQTLLTSTLQNHVTALVNASHVNGPFFLGSHISYVDVAVSPWIIRMSRVLKYYRGWPDPEVGSRWESWVQAIEEDDRIRGFGAKQAGIELHVGIENGGWKSLAE
ncbi:putative glutathione transferase [Phaeomoniella chlamydospora]|uniref:Putative glutathione transferase n=1 Tax=Phaeomoniella chlamydospora TaxID=158046 RepID=A0A0G2GNI1_PHACM|nr:putative glutathione transferase [Phaeomoniella chlamydospora]